MKKIIAFIMVAAIALTCGITAFAADTFDITGARLLNDTEYEALSGTYRKYSDSYWMNTDAVVSGSGTLSKAYAVNANGEKISMYEDYKALVRPVLVLENLDASDHKIGDIFTFGDKKFVVISDTAAFCVTDIGEAYFNASGDASYSTSALKKDVDEWFEDNEDDGYTWAATKYTLTFSAGTVKTFDSLSLASGATITFPSTDVDGYVFDGWYTDSTLKTKFTATVMPAANTTLYGSYAKAYTLSFSAGSIKTFDSLSLASGATITLPDTDVEGYKFNGWYTDSTLKTAFTATTMPAANTTLYASYTKLYKLSFDTNGVQKIADQWYEKDAILALPDGKADGYVFVGWFADAEYKTLFTLQKMPAADTTVYGLYAVNLSKLSEELSEVDVAKTVSDLGLSVDTFKKLATGLGFEIKYTINGKEYTVEDIVNYVDEITKQVEIDVAKGETAGVDVSIKLGKDDTAKTFTFNLFNDIGSAIVVDNDDDTADTTATDTDANVVVDDDDDVDSVDTDTDTDSEEDVPNTGSESVLPILITLLSSTATAGGIVIKKKKED